MHWGAVFLLICCEAHFQISQFGAFKMFLWSCTLTLLVVGLRFGSRHSEYINLREMGLNIRRSSFFFEESNVAHGLRT